MGVPERTSRWSARSEQPGDLGRLRAWVFDILAFVQHDGQPLDRNERLAQDAKLAVIDDVQIRLAKTVDRKSSKLLAAIA
jgi:hypothetical protein